MYNMPLDTGLNLEDLKLAKAFLQGIADHDLRADSFLEADPNSVRIQNQVAFLLDVSEVSQRLDGPFRKIELEFLSNILEAVSYIENPIVINFWKKLVISAMNPEEPNEFHGYFINLLKNISLPSYTVLVLLYKHSFQNHSEELSPLSHKFIKTQTGFHQSILEIIFDQLQQLRLVQSFVSIEEQAPVVPSYQLTKLGVALLRIVI